MFSNSLLASGAGPSFRDALLNHIASQWTAISARHISDRGSLPCSALAGTVAFFAEELFKHILTPDNSLAWCEVQQRAAYTPHRADIGRDPFCVNEFIAHALTLVASLAAECSRRAHRNTAHP